MKRPLSAILLLIATNVQAGSFQDGNALLQLCDKNSPILYGYVMGVTDYQALYFVDSDGNPMIPGYVCLPDRITSRQAVDVTCNYLRSHPANRQMDGANLVWLALQQAWPCR